MLNRLADFRSAKGPIRRGEPRTSDLRSRFAAIALALLGAFALPSATSAAPAVTATKDDGLAAGVKVLPGGQITYTINISNGSAVGTTDALNMTLTDAAPANTADVGGSLIASPVAVNDTYPQTVIGNVSINSANIPYSVVTNDFLGLNPSATITAFDSTSASGGTVSMTTSGAGIGQFTYNPPPGFEGTDTFTYTLSDNAGAPSAVANRKATVSIPVSGMVWFINNTAGAGDGRLSSPFNTLAAFQAVNDGAGNHPAANDNIFIYESGTAYVGPVTLLNGQKLIGQDATVSLATITGLNPPSSSASFPAMNSGNGTITKITSAANAVNLTNGATSNLIRGLTIGNTTGSGISGTSFGTLTLADVSLSDTPTRAGQALNLASGAVSGTIDTLSSTSGTNNVALSTVSGNVSINGGAINGATGAAWTMSSSSATVSYSGSITSTTGGISLTSNTGATISFTGALSLATAGNSGFTATGGGTVSATDTTSTITTTTGTALNVANTTIGAGNLKFKSISAGTAASGPANGIILNNTGTLGSLIVLGTGSAGTGGTIQKTSSDAIALATTKNLDLSFMNIQNSAAGAVNGTGVNGFSLTSCSITNNTGGLNSGSTASVILTDTTGAVAFISDTVSGTTAANGFNVQLNSSNASTAAITTLTVTGGTYSNAALNGGFLINQKGTAKLGAAFFSGVTFSGNFSKGLQLQQNDNSIMGDSTTVPLGSWSPAPPNGSVTVTGCTFTNNNVQASFEGGGGTNGTGSAYYRFVNNLNINGSQSVAVNFANGSDSGGGTFKAFVSGNHIGTNNVPNSGSAIGEGLRVFMQGQQAATVTIINNVIRALYNGVNGFGARGIDVEELGRPNAGFGQTRLDVKIVGNDVDGQFTNFPQYAIYVAADAQGTGTSGSDIRAEIHGNTVPALSGCDTQCAASTGMIDYETVNSTGTRSGTLFQTGAGGSVSNEIATTNTGTAGKTCSFVNGGTLTLTNTAPNTVPLLFAPGGVEKAAKSEAAKVTGVSVPALPAVVTTTPSVRAFSVAKNYKAELLTQVDLDSVVAAAMARWEATGLSADQVATLRKLQFEVADLPDLRLGEADDNRIRVDKNAGGNGWFIDVKGGSDALFAKDASGTRSYTDSSSTPAGRIDLLTAIMHEMGHALGLNDSYLEQDRDSLMFGFLTKGERRLPLKDQAKGATPGSVTGMHFLGSPVNIGTLPPGKSVIVIFKVQVDSPTAATSVSNQGTVAGTGFSILTDDPTVGGAADPTVTPVEQPPVVSNFSLPSVNEDGTLTFTASSFDPGFTDPNAGDTLQSVKILSLPANGVLKLGAVNVAVNDVIPRGSLSTLTYKPNADYNGSDSFTWNGSDGTLFALNGATANVTVNSVNDVPSFTKGADQTVLEDAGAQSVIGWATNISPGPANESGQTVDFIVTNGNNSLFSVQPAISPGGDLTYTPAADANGTALVSVKIHDNGGTSPGVDTSAAQTFNINVTAVNDAPTLNTITDPAPININSGLQTVSLSGITTGPANESGQTPITVTALSNNTGLIPNPTVTYTSANPTGSLSYTPVAGQSGTAVITVTVKDSGGTSPGVDTFQRMFTVVVKPGSTTALVSSQNPSGNALPVTFTATVSPNTATGSVQFFDGANPLVCTENGGNSTQPLVSAQATCTTSSLSVAGSPHPITAVYSGDTNLSPSTSNTVQQNVQNCANPAIVKNTNDAGADSLRQALLDVCDGGVINFQAGLTGTITLTTGELLINKNVKITGPGATVITVSGNNASRVFEVQSGKAVSISGLTIANGHAITGGPFASEGGGIFNDHGTLTVTNCVLSGNIADDSGGGIFNNGYPSGSSTLVVKNSTFANNTGINGGGLYNYGDTGTATVDVLNSTFTNNSTSASGGVGGAIDNYGAGASGNATLRLVNTTISGNKSNADGGGIYNTNNASAAVAATTLTNVTVTDNRADNDTNTTGAGGGIRAVDGTVTLKNTMVAGNFNGGSPSTTPDDINGSVNADYSLIGKITGATITGANNQLNVDPLLGALANNGGPTQTHVPALGSLAINNGNNALLPADTFDLDNDANVAETLPVEQRGPGFPRVVNTTVDIGAVEANYMVAATTGSGQSTTIGTNFPTALQATVSESVNPISGVVVTFTAPASEPTGNFAGSATTTATSNASGLTVPARTFTASNTAGGPYNVVASAAGYSSANFAMTNTTATTGMTTQVSTAATTVGTVVTDTATLTGGVSATGTVTFNVYASADNTCVAAPIFTSTVPLNGGNTATSGNFTPTAPGTYRWRALYSGDANNSAIATACNDANETTVVSQATPTVTTTASAATTVGNNISDSATINGGYNVTGTITFTLYKNDNACGAGNLVFTSAAIPVTAGNNTYGSGNFTPTAAGTYRWIATYLGDANNNDVAGLCGAANETVVVNKVTPSIATQASANVGLGNAVSDTATLSNGATPTGTITFRLYGPNDNTCAAGSLVFTSAAIPVSGNNNPVGSGSFTPTAAGTYYWIATYSGDGNNNTVAGACNVAQESVTISQGTTTTTVSTAKSPTVFGESVTFTATVAANAPATTARTGTVQFQVDGVNTGGSVALSGNQAQFTTSTLSVSAGHTIKATYSGDANYLTSSASVTQVVNKANTTTTVTSSANPSTPGQNVTFTATVAAGPPGAGTLTGTVQFMIDGVNAGGPIALSSGTAQFSTSTLTVAGSPHSVSATYSGDANFFGSSGSLAGGQTVAAPTPTPTPTPTATPTPTPTPTATPAQALNIATRLRVDIGDKVMIGGFIIRGNAAKSVVLRGLGPSLVNLNVPVAEVLKDPVLELRGPNGALITSNDDWVLSPQKSQIENTPFQPSSTKEAVILATLVPGNYTAILSGALQTTGIGLVEIYDVNPAVDSDLANISTRGFVQGGNNVMIGGFTLGGNSNPTRIAVRALGPSLTSYGLSNVLADPTLELHNANGTIMVSNDNWGDDPVSAAGLIANGLAPLNPLESGIFTSLAPPGQFTAIVAGKNGGIGIALVEIYDLR